MLILTVSNDEPVKQATALALIHRLQSAHWAVISHQVLNEFASVALRKLKISAPYVRQQVESMSRLEVITVTQDFIREAIDIHQLRWINYTDTLMVATAKIASCSILYTEDMNLETAVDRLTCRDEP